MLNVPACAAPAVGVSVTATLHCTGAGNDPTQVFELTENGAVAETVPNATGPELVTVTLCGALVCPTATVPRFNDVGVTDSDEVAVPVSGRV